MAHRGAGIVGQAWGGGSLSAGARLLAVGALLPLAALGIAGMSPEHLLDRTYGGTMQRIEAAWTGPSAAEAALKLTGLPPQAPVMRLLARGDRIVIDTRNGGRETVEVVAIEQMDGAALGLDGITLQIVTARAETAAEGEVMRFLFSIGRPPAAPKTDHAL